MRKGRAALGLLMIAIVGCGDRRPTLVPVHGRVTLDGKPLMQKAVQFVPDAETPGGGARANTDHDGKYTLLAVCPGTTRDMPGAPAGSYRVVVTEPMLPIDLPAPQADDTRPAPAVSLSRSGAKSSSAIPPAYWKPGTTPLRVTVPEDGGELALDIQTSNGTKASTGE